ncbi:MAG: VanZ family protein [Candidatus Altiarchaeota archaeon]
MANPVKWLEDHPLLASNLAVLYAGAIFILSSMPKVPKPPGPWYTSFLIHFIEYLGFGFIVLIAVRGNKAAKNPLVFAVAICILYAFSDEIHQYFVPERVADIWDVFFDSMGSATGAAAANTLRRT